MKHLNEIQQFLYVDECMKLGVVPTQNSIESPLPILQKMPPEEARIAKRKFRKLLRKKVGLHSNGVEPNEYVAAERRRLAQTYLLARVRERDLELRKIKNDK